jgi:hypothetical protein
MEKPPWNQSDRLIPNSSLFENTENIFLTF